MTSIKVSLSRFIEAEIAENDSKKEALNLLNDESIHRRHRNEIMMHVIPVNKNNNGENQARVPYHVFSRVCFLSL